ncbi:MAG: hypothetical protein ACLULK_07565 [Anaerovoracaceae bacterium]
MTNQAIVRDESRLSFKAQTVAALIAVVAAVVLPQIFHGIGIVSGTGAAMGAAFLPMYLPVMMVGFLAGPYAGAVSGIAAPLISFAVTGMPAAAVLPMIAVEVTACGLFAGLSRSVNMPLILKVLAVQVVGKVFRLGAVFAMIYIAGSQMPAFSSVWMSAKQGLPGIILQLAIIPLVVFYVNNKSKDEE